MDEQEFLSGLSERVRAAEAQRQAAADEREAARYQESQRRLLNGRAIERHIRQVIEPILHLSCQRLRELGFTAGVELILQKDFSYGPEETVCAIGIILGGCPGVVPSSHRFPHRLGYRGDFGSLGIARELVVSDRTMESGSAPFSLDVFTAEMVQRDAFSFLERVLAARVP